ncbi:MAG: SDR family NAD(P)-dependent oxidoreductase, partial [Clostridia bacterium]|nr:SDR family NAD(P)-dependent oxidoreductase [Clostridia bacterium]
KAFAKELDESESKVKIGRLSPGIMITDFTVKSLGGENKITLPEKTKKVYNILGDYPDVVADFLSKRIEENTNNNAHIEWLTGRKAALRFMTAVFNKRDFFA